MGPWFYIFYENCSDQSIIFWVYFHSTRYFSLDFPWLIKYTWTSMRTFSKFQGISLLSVWFWYTLSGLSNLTTLNLRRNSRITAQGMSVFSGLVNLLKLDLERCPGIHGGLVHLKGLFLSCTIAEWLVSSAMCMCNALTYLKKVFKASLNLYYSWYFLDLPYLIVE